MTNHPKPFYSFKKVDLDNETWTAKQAQNERYFILDNNTYIVDPYNAFIETLEYYEPILDPTIRVVLRNSLNSSEFTIAIGETFKLGDAKTGEEEYKVVSANITTREVVVESIDSSKTRYSIRPRISLP